MVLPLILLAAVLAQVPGGGSTRRDSELIAAAKLGDLRRARELVTAGTPVDVADRRGYTPLGGTSPAGAATRRWCGPRPQARST
jgi:hypothetical protein